MDDRAALLWRGVTCKNIGLMTVPLGSLGIPMITDLTLNEFEAIGLGGTIIVCKLLPFTLKTTIGQLGIGPQRQPQRQPQRNLSQPATQPQVRPSSNRFSRPSMPATDVRLQQGNQYVRGRYEPPSRRNRGGRSNRPNNNPARQVEVQNQRRVYADGGSRQVNPPRQAYSQDPRQAPSWRGNQRPQPEPPQQNPRGGYGSRGTQRRNRPSPFGEARPVDPPPRHQQTEGFPQQRYNNSGNQRVQTQDDGEPKRRSSVDETPPNGGDGSQANPARVLIVLRGLPGSGKSWLTRRVVTSNSQIDVKVCSAAIYHWTSQEEGVGTKVYNPNANKLCLESAFSAMDAGYRLIIIDNVHSRVSDYNEAVVAAQKKNYTVRIVEYRHTTPEDLYYIKARRVLEPYQVSSNVPRPSMTFDQEWEHYLKNWEQDQRAEITPPEIPRS